MQKFEFLSNVWWLCLPSFFSVLNAFKYPLLIGTGLATVIGLLSCLIGYCSSRWCCKKEVQETRRERRRLMSMEMDWVWEPGTPAFRERLTGLLDCAETLIHGPRWDSAFPLWFQSGPQASPCYRLCPESFQAISSDSEFSFLQQHFLHWGHVLLTYELLNLLSAGPCDKNSLCVFWFLIFCFCPSWFWKDLPLWEHVEECGVQEGTGKIIRLSLY